MQFALMEFDQTLSCRPSHNLLQKDINNVSLQFSTHKFFEKGFGSKPATLLDH